MVAIGTTLKLVMIAVALLGLYFTWLKPSQESQTGEPSFTDRVQDQISKGIDWSGQTSNVAGYQFPNWVILLVAIVCLYAIIKR